MPGEAVYYGAHSITFSIGEREQGGRRKRYLKGKNTWTDWHLIPLSKPVVSSPGVATNYVQIPGRSGALDLTDWITGGTLVYGQRSGTWEFLIDNGWEYWEDIRKEIMNYLHGKTYKVVLEDAPSWYWEGRFTVASFTSEETNNKISINYTLDPYCYSVLDPEEDWIWDPFDFDFDYTDNATHREARL